MKLGQCPQFDRDCRNRKTMKSFTFLRLDSGNPCRNDGLT